MIYHNKIEHTSQLGTLYREEPQCFHRVIERVEWKLFAFDELYYE